VTATDVRATTGAALLRADPARLDDVFERLRRRVSSDGALPVAAIAIGDAEGVVRSETFTSAGPAISRDSMFFLASLTKPIFATAFLQLIEDGTVGLHQPIAEFEPRFRGGGRENVTPWHVLTHTSGVADIQPDVIRRRRPTASQMTRLVVDSPLRFEPGTRWEYCSASFYLLALLMERTTDKTYVRFFHERLLRPLGMATTFDPRRAGRPIVTVEGVGADNRLLRFLILRYLARAAVPGGGLFGTLDDLMHFGAAVLRPREVGGRAVPLRPETQALAGEDHTRGIIGFDDGVERPVHFGLGWGKPTLMRDGPGSPRVISHGGATGTRLWIDPAAGLVFVFFTNRWSAERAVEAEALRGTYEAMRT
jgi:CubicO group peptidase (beta-lactamase class C family)